MLGLALTGFEQGSSDDVGFFLISLDFQIWCLFWYIHRLRPVTIPCCKFMLLTNTLANPFGSHAGQQLENNSLYACVSSPGLELAPAPLTLAKQNTLS